MLAMERELQQQQQLVLLTQRRHEEEIQSMQQSLQMQHTHELRQVHLHLAEKHSHAIREREVEASSTLAVLEGFLHEQQAKETARNEEAAILKAQVASLLTQQRGDSADPVLVPSQSHAPPSAKPLDNHSGLHTASATSSSVEHQRLNALDIANPLPDNATDLAAARTQTPAPSSILTGQLAAAVRANGGKAVGGSQAPALTIKVRKATTRLPELTPEAVAAIVAERAVIEKAESKIKALADLHSIKLKIPRPSDRPSRTSEKTMARMTGDDEVLQHGSTRIKDETRSSDDEAEILRELDPRIAQQKLFSPKAPITTRTADGYVLNAFIDNSSDHGGSQASTDHDDDDDDDPDSDCDDDSDEDYIQSESSTPSESRKKSIRIPKADMAAFQAFKAHQATLTSAEAHSPKSAKVRGGTSPPRARTPPSSRTPPHSSARGSPAPRTHHAISQSTAPPGYVPAELVMSLLQHSSQPNKAPEPSIDQHGRLEREFVHDFAIPLPPPEHGEWDDVEHLMNKFLPVYERYKHSCKRGYHNSIWELYTPTQRRKIAKFLSDKADEHSVNAKHDSLAQLTNEDFLAQLCAAKGHSTSSLTELALRAIEFKGKLTEKASWINHETAWEECLKKSSANGIVEEKRLLTIYRDSIPDQYFQSALLQRKFFTWKEAHAFILTQLKNTAFIIPYHETCVKRLQQEASSTSLRRGEQEKPSSKPRHPADSTSSHRDREPHAGGAATPAHERSDKSEFKPLDYRNQYGIRNVNPNMKNPNFTLNKDNTPCSRCGRTHKWTADMCTEAESKDGTPLTMSKDEVTTRMLARWSAGFFFKKRVAAAYASPSAQESAAASTKAANAIQGGGGVTKK